jgi:signal-transduction protein with cAMP-binding, CBS, and nucleotidyltransferase domain
MKGVQMSTVRRLLETKGKFIWTTSPTASVFNALKLMANKDIGALVVIDGTTLAGIVSERDYARRIILEELDPRETKVQDIMTTKVITVHPEQTIQECMLIMNKNHIRHLPVLLDDKVIGVISQGDVVRDLIYQQRKKIQNLEDRLTSNRKVI